MPLTEKKTSKIWVQYITMFLELTPDPENETSVVCYSIIFSADWENSYIR